MFRVTGEDDVIILETTHKPTAQQSKEQYEASMGKKAAIIELEYTDKGYKPLDKKVKTEKKEEVDETPEPQITGAHEATQKEARND